MGSGGVEIPAGGGSPGGAGVRGIASREPHAHVAAPTETMNPIAATIRRNVTTRAMIAALLDWLASLSGGDLP
jgi:hypothetical protein